MLLWRCYGNVEQPYLPLVYTCEITNVLKIGLKCVKQHPIKLQFLTNYTSIKINFSTAQMLNKTEFLTIRSHFHVEHNNRTLNASEGVQLGGKTHTPTQLCHVINTPPAKQPIRLVSYSSYLVYCYFVAMNYVIPLIVIVIVQSQMAWISNSTLVQEMTFSVIFFHVCLSCHFIALPPHLRDHCATYAQLLFQ